VEEVNMIGLALLLAMFQGSATDDPFNSYLNSVKEHRASSELASFVSDCGYDWNEADPIYAVSKGNKWVPSRSLAKAANETESDFFSSAEVWTKDGKARVIVLWSLELDVGSEIRTMACISNDGRPRKLQVTNWSFPVDREGLKWTHQQYKTFDKADKVVLNQGHFEDSGGRQIARPKLDEDSQGSFEWVPDASAFLKIESDLLDTNRVSTGKR
jgi:hypothetical protein